MNEWKQTFKILKQILSDALLFALASCLLFEFILIWLSADNTIWIGEPNVYIRTIETALLCFIIVWMVQRITTKLRQVRRQNGNQKIKTTISQDKRGTLRHDSY